MILGRVLVWIFFFSLPWTGAVVALGVPSPARALGIFAICSTIVYVLQKGIRPPGEGEAYLGFFLAIYLGSYFWVVSVSNWGYRIESLISVIVAASVFWQCSGRLLSFSSIAASISLGSVFLALTVLGARLVGVEYGFGRVSAGTLDPNEVAFTLVCGMALLGGRFLSVPSGLRFALQLVIALAVLQTGSRTGLLAMVMVSASFVLVSGFSFKRTLLVLGAIAIAVAMVLLAWDFLPTEVTKRTEGTIAEFRGERETDRLNVWGRVIEVVGRSLPFGVGGAGVASALNFMTGRYVEAHNVPLSVLAQFGVLGGVFLVAFFASFFKSVIKVWRVPGMLALTSAVVCFMQMLSLEYRPIFWVSVLIVFRAAQIMAQERKPASEGAVLK